MNTPLGSTRRTARPGRRLRITLALVATCSMAAACGGSSDSPEKATGGKEAETVSAAQARVEPHFGDIPKVPVTTPLTSKPESGKVVYLIRYNISTAATLDAPSEAAAEALGWTVKVLAVDATDPQSMSNATSQAVAAHADFIFVSSGSAEVLGAGLKEAKDANIPVFFQAATTDPAGAENGIYGNANAGFLSDGILRLLDIAVVDSDGSGSMLLLSAPDFPIVASAQQTDQKEFAKNCPTCSLEVQEISGADLNSGATAGLTVAAIRKNPKIKYVVAMIDGMVLGLPEALKAAGLTDVKILISAPSQDQVPGIATGTYLAGSMYPNASVPWESFDQMARYDVGMDTEQEAHELSPYPVWTKDNVPDGATSFPGTPGYEDEYKKLWLVQ